MRPGPLLVNIQYDIEELSSSFGRLKRPPPVLEAPNEGLTRNLDEKELGYEYIYSFPRFLESSALRL